MLRNLRGDTSLLDAVAERTPLGRVGRPEELAAVICFLLSDEASYLTGQTISVDGGRIIAGPAVADTIPTVRS